MPVFTTDVQYSSWVWLVGFISLASKSEGPFYLEIVFQMLSIGQQYDVGLIINNGCPVYFKWPLFQLIGFINLYGALASVYGAPVYLKRGTVIVGWYLYTTTAGLPLAVWCSCLNYYHAR